MERKRKNTKKKNQSHVEISLPIYVPRSCAHGNTENRDAPLDLEVADAFAGVGDDGGGVGGAVCL